MTISSVAVDDPVEAPTVNQLIDNVNASPGRAILTSNGNWSVPSGVHKFKVTLCGGGSGAQPDQVGGGGEDSYIIPGLPGTSSHMISACFAGIDVGTTYVVTVGAAGAASQGTGGTTSFGTSLVSPGAAYGNKGSVSSGGGAAQLLYYDHVYLSSAGWRYGDGGAGSGAAGRAGICVIEW